jgi:hypothetical protein
LDSKIRSKDKNKKLKRFSKSPGFHLISSKEFDSTEMKFHSKTPMPTSQARKFDAKIDKFSLESSAEKLSSSKNFKKSSSKFLEVPSNVNINKRNSAHEISMMNKGVALFHSSSPIKPRLVQTIYKNKESETLDDSLSSDISQNNDMTNTTYLQISDLDPITPLEGNKKNLLYSMPSHTPRKLSNELY